MVKQIINWTAGSFFRTLGRILLYITIGALIGLFCVKNDIKLPAWLTMVERVDAATNVSVSSWGHNLGYYTGTADNPTYNSTGWFTGDKTLPAGYLGIYIDQLRVIYNSALSTANTYNITFDSYYNPRTNLNYFKKARVVFTGSSTGSNSGSSEAAIKNGVCIPGISEGTATKVTWSCSFQPTIALNYMRIEIYFDDLYYIQSYGCLKPTVIFDNAQVDAITNQTLIIQQETEIINNSINDLNDTLEDTDVNSDTNDMADFINNFELSGSTQLSDLLTIPITFIQNVLVDSTPNDFCTTWRNKQICLPNGNLIWGRNDITPFKTFFNILVGGFLSYKMIISFLFTSEKALDPNEKKVEVLKF